MTLEQLKSFSSAVAGFVADGMKLAPDEERASRYTICQACEHFRPEEFMGHGKCSVCGCNMLMKTAMPAQECPVGKWKAIKPV